MDPEVVIWITLAINVAGVLLMLGGKNQVIKDLGTRVTRTETKIEGLEKDKLAVVDYRREKEDFNELYREDRQSHNQEIRAVHGRLDHIERAGWQGGRSR